MSRVRMKAAGREEWLEFDFTLDNQGLFSWEEGGLALQGRIVAPSLHGGDAEGWLDVDGTITPFVACRVKNRVHVWAGGDMAWLELATAGGASRHAPAPAGDDITAPMPGTVLKVMAEAGAVVEAQQPMLVMESMKMELTLQAPRAGKIGKVLCKEGDLVDMGAVLATLEKQA